MNTKKLIITGKNNVETISDLGDERIKINALENEIEHEKALSLLLDLDKCELFTKEDILYKKAKREINDKINSYKQQDIKKNIHNKDTLITFNNIKNKLKIRKSINFINFLSKRYENGIINHINIAAFKVFI